MFKKFQLKNGLTVLLVESHKSPVVSAQMWVRTGSADEGKGIEGISHFIEHLVFKGSEKYEVGEIARVVEGSGGELNAYTSFDQTVFYVTISKNFLGTALDVIAEMMGKPKFDKAEIDNEREVVIEEIKRGQDNPHRQASRLLFETLYKKHPYGIPVIGYEENIRTVSREKILKYYNSRYVPSNMTLLLIGDFSSKEVIPEIKNRFGTFKKRALKKVVRKKEPAQKSARIEVKKLPFQENLIYLAWPLPSAKHKDVAALDLASLILGQGESSRLNEALRIQRHITNYVGASTFTPMDNGFFAATASFQYADLEDVVRGIFREIRKFLEEGPTEEELRKALVNMNSEDFYSLETVDGMARKFGSFEHLFKNYKYHEKYLAQMNKLTGADVVKAFKKYLDPKKLSLIFMSGEDEQKSVQLLQTVFDEERELLVKKLKEKQTGGFKKKIKVSFSKALKKTSKENSLRKVQLSSGATVLLRPNFDTPIVHLKAAFLGGMRAEWGHTEGATELLSRVWVPDHMQPAIEGMASSLGAFGGRNSAGLSMTTLSAFSKPMLEMFGKTLVANDFEEEIIAREKKAMLEQIRLREDNPSQICVLQFMKRIFPNHPYGVDPLGDQATTSKLGEKDIKNLLKCIRSAKNLTFSVSGAFDEAEWLAALEKMSKDLEKQPKFSKSFPIVELGKSEKLFSATNKEQTHIIVGYPGLSLTDPERYTLQVIQSVLAGQGGRLFLELRDKNSLAYSVSPLRMEGLERGYFGAYIACSPDKSEKAIQMMRTEFGKLQKHAVPEEELGRAKRYLIGRHDIDLQKNSAVAGAVLFDDIYGIPYDETFHYGEKIAAVTAEQVKALAQKLFSRPEVLSVVGKSEPAAV